MSDDDNPMSGDTVADVSAAPTRASRVSGASMPPQHRRYTVGEEVGRGGMGRITRARDTALLCDVAMKMLDPEYERDMSLVERFVEEAQIQSQLDHPNIVPVHELGRDAEGRVFFTMKYVRGVSLHDWLLDASRPVGSSERLVDALEIFLKVCDGISFAHSRGVIHRDLKPANIMIGQFGEVYVMDWGLSAVTGAEVRTTRERDELEFPSGPVGTPAYISPEAARGEECDERSDVYGLGGVLYQIVSGKTPYVRDGRAALAAAKTGAYRPLFDGLGFAGVSKPILRIIEKALAPAPDQRYQTAAELKAAVRRFLRGGLYLPRRTFTPGQRIITEGDLGHAAFVIMQGTCEAFKTIDGERRVLRQMVKGDVFGETAVLSDLPRTASVDAVDEVIVLVIDRAALEEGIGVDSWLGALVRALAMRFRELDAELHARSRDR